MRGDPVLDMTRVSRLVRQLPSRGYVSVDRVMMQLLGGFDLRFRGTPLTVAPGGERRLAFLALRGSVARRSVEYRLWPDHTEDHAQGCLRSTIWRLPKPAGAALVRADGCRLTLADHVAVDVAEVSRSVAISVVDDLVDDVLPDWYDDWVVVDRERFRQVRLHALEALSERLRTSGRYVEAILAGMRAVDAEPLRESAHRQVVLAHLAEGNISEALRQVRTLLGLLADLGLPQALSPVLSDLLPSAIRL